MVCQTLKPRSSTHILHRCLLILLQGEVLDAGRLLRDSHGRQLSQPPAAYDLVKIHI